jgi:uncharacterized RDD family membrane protein YckC
MALDPAELPDRALGRRIGAAVIDLVVLLPLAIGLAAVSGDATAEDGQASFHLEGSSLAGFLALSVVYFVIFELVAGASIGKLLPGVRVANEDGRRPAPWQIVVRNVLRPIDLLPVLYLIGFVVLMASGPHSRQRIGDRVARTIVIPRGSIRPPPTQLENAAPGS